MVDALGTGCSLGVVGIPTGFHLLEDISAHEYEHLVDAIREITRLDAGFHSKLVERNYVELESIHQFVTITLSLGRDFATPDRTQLGEALMTSIVNWLTAMRLFLDHEETDLKRRFGKNSPQVRQFKSATAAAFDDRLGYRFSYRFRNFVQHCGRPLSRIETRRVVNGSTRARQTVDLVLDRDFLLRVYDGRGPVKADLTAMPPTFGLLPLAAEAMEGLRDVHRVCTELNLDEALDHSATVLAALERIEMHQAIGHPAIFRYDGDFRDKANVSLVMIPAAGARKLAPVRSGAESRESIWSEPAERHPLLFDPATIRERFHRDSRGVQVLSAWLAEQGGSPAFFKVVNQILADDQSLEPLITGLINVSAILAHMTASAIGTSAEALVAGLLDIYGEFESPDPDDAASELSD
jgi:hypothetical protein